MGETQWNDNVQLTRFVESVVDFQHEVNEHKHGRVRRHDEVRVIHGHVGGAQVQPEEYIYNWREKHALILWKSKCMYISSLLSYY